MKEYNYEKSFFYEGKRYRVRGDSEADVIRKMTLKKKELEEHKVILNRSTTVREWSELCISTYKPNISENRRRQLGYTLKNHIYPFIGDMPISSVKPINCQAILNILTGMSKDTIVKTSQLMNLIFKTAMDNQLIIVNPTSGVVRPDGTVAHRRAITETERRHLLKVCENDKRFVPFLFMLLCGCRPGEALAIRANDIKLIEDVKVLHIRGTKTENADRMVPIPLDFVEYLDRITPKGFGLYAEKERGGAHTDNSYRNLVRRLKRELNLSMGARTYRNALVPPLPLAEDFEPYCLRHTYCTDLKKAGIPLSIAKDYMGHADIATTANIYSHSDDDTILAGAEILGIRKTS